MSKQIDERIVSMQFDNSSFEKNAQTSLSTLDKLKQALNFDGVGKGLTDLGNVSSAVSSISGFGTAVDNVKEKFSVLETIAVGALLKIGSQAVEAGEKLVKSLSVDLINAGWTKYAEKTTSVQTIMSATADQFAEQGEQMEYVTEQLEKLNWFTDETSYNFVDMTSNIGKFTSQNVKLEEAVTAMEGISVWAAQSGQNAAAASRVMYNLSQSLGMGAVRVQDWMSVENANMATKEFKEIAIAAGIASGAIKEGQVTVENFRDSLGAKETKNWFSKDVLMTALKQYGTFTDVLYDVMDRYDELGATTSEVLGYLEEYTNGTLDAEAVANEYGITVQQLTSDLEKLSGTELELGRKSFRAAQEAKTFEEAIDATKDAVSTAWMNIFETIFGNYLEAKQLWTDLANYLYDVFAEPINKLGALLSAWASEDNGGREALLEGFYAIGEAITAVSEIIKDAWNSVFPRKTTAEMAKGLATISKKFRDFAKKLTPTEKAAETIKTVFQGLFSILSIGVKVIKSVANALKPLGSTLKNVIGIVEKAILGIANFIIQLDKTISETNLLDKAFENISTGVNKVIDGFKEFITTITNAYKESGSFAEALKVGIDTVIDKVKNLVLNIVDAVSQVTGFDLSKIYDKVDDIFNHIKSTVDNFDWEHLFDIESAIASFKERVIAAFGQIGEWYNEGGGGLTGIANVILNMIDNALVTLAEKIKEITGLDLTDIVSKISTAIGNACEKIQEFVDKADDIEQINKKLSITQAIFQGITDVVKGFFDAVVNVIKGIGDAIAASPLIAAFALFGFKDIASFTKAITELVDTLKEMAKGGELLTTISEGFKTAADSIKEGLNAITKDIAVNDVLKIAIAIGILALALVQISKVPVDKIVAVMGAITGLFGELIGTMALIDRIPDISYLSRSMAMELIKVAIAVAILSTAMEKFAKLNPEQLAAGIMATAGAMMLLAGGMMGLYIITATWTQKDIAKIGEAAVVLIIISVAVSKLADSISKLAGITDLTALAAGIGGIIVGLAMLAYVANYLKNAVSIKTAIVLLALAESMKILTDSIVALSEMDFGKMMIGLFGVLAGMTSLAICAGILQKTMGIQASIAVLAMAAAISMLTDSVVALASVDLANMLVGFLMLMSMMLVMRAVLETMPGHAIAAAAGFVIMALGVSILADALLSLVNLELGQLVTPLIGLGVAVAGLVFAMQKMSANMVGAMAFAVAAAGVEMIAAAIAKLKDVNGDQLAATMMALGAAVVVLAVGIKAMEGSMVGALAMLVASGAMLAMAAAINLLSVIPIDQIAAAIILIGVAIAGFAVAATALTPVLPIMEGFAIGIGIMLAAMGAGVLVMAAGLLLMSTAISAMAVSGAAAAEGLTLFGQALTTYIGVLVEASLLFGPLGIGLLVFGVAAVVAGIGATALGAGLVVMALGVGLLGGAMAILENFSAGLAETGLQIVSFVLTLASFTAQMIVTALGIAALGLAFVAFSLGSVALDLALVALAATVAIVSIAFDGLALAVGDCADGIGRIGDALVNIATFGPTAAVALGETALALLAAAPDIKKAGEEMAPFADAIEDILDVLNDFNAALLLTISQFTLITAEATAMSLAITTATAAFTLFVTTLDSFEMSALSAFDKVNIAFANFCVGFLASISTYGNRIKNMAKTLSREIVNDGFKYYLNLSEGRKLGQNFMIGIANGLKDKETYVCGRAKQLGNAVTKSMKDSMKIASPSKVGIWMGQMMDKGLGLGLENYTRLATRPASGVGNSVTSAMEESLSLVSDMFNYDLDTEPVITPVIDLTDARKGMDNLNDLMDLQSIRSIATNFDINNARMLNAPYEQQDMENKLFDRLIKAINDTSAESIPVDIQVNVTQDDQGMFTATASQNDMYKKRFGRTRFA